MAERTPLYEQTSATGAVFVEEAGFLMPGRFGDPAAEYAQARTGAVLVDESHRGKVMARGADAARFLHNLTTNDILNLAPGRGCETFLTTAKAKVIAYLLLYRQDTVSFWLDVAPGAAERVIQHLDRYLISEQVEFLDHSRAFAQMQLAGPGAPSLLRQVFGLESVPDEQLKHATVALSSAVEGHIRRHDALGLPGYNLVCPAEGAPDIWRRLTEAGARPIGREACETLRVEAGLPREGVDIDENTFAPEVGRIAQTISYTKGCYLGQESIVMARDRGQVNRGLVGVKLSGGPVPLGSRLFVQDKEVGRVTSSVVSQRLGAALGLAYVRRGHQTPGTIVEVEVAGARAPAEVVRLPL
jgi:folate-binding protein YgfZ